MPHGMEVGLYAGHIVLDGNPAPPPRGTAAPSPEFSAHACCAQTAGWIKMPLMEVDLGPGHIVWEPSPPPSKGHSPEFSALACCGQTVGWIKMALATEVDLGLGHIVLDGDPAPSEMDTAAPSFDPCLL